MHVMTDPPRSLHADVLLLTLGSLLPYVRIFECYFAFKFLCHMWALLRMFRNLSWVTGHEDAALWGVDFIITIVYEV